MRRKLVCDRTILHKCRQFTTHSESFAFCRLAQPLQIVKTCRSCDLHVITQGSSHKAVSTLG